MERGGQEEGAQPGGRTPQERDVRHQLSELERVMKGVRQSIERVGGTVREAAEKEEKEGGPRHTGAGGEAGEQPEPESAAPAEQGEGAVEQAGEAAPQGEEAPQGEAAEPSEEGKAERKGAPEEETVALYDGSEQAMGAWKKVGAGDLEQRDEGLFVRAGRDRGLAYYARRRFDDFRWKAQYRLSTPQAPVSAAFRFLDPEKPVPDRKQPDKKHRYDNQAYVAAHTGFEICLGAGPAGEPGTLAGIPPGEAPGSQRRSQSAELKSEDWNELEVEVRGNEYSVRLNGAETARFTNSDEWRGRPASAGEDAGYIGILSGEQPRPGRQAGGRPAAGPLPLRMPGAVLPGRLPGSKPAPSGPAPQQEAPEISATFRRVEVQVLKPEVSEEKKKLARKDLAAIHEEVAGALARIKAKDQGLEGTLKKAYGYAVLPSVGRASLVLGGARGYGEVFEQGKPIGFTRVTQLTIGVQVGGQSFTQLLLFGSKESLEAFKRSPLAFNGNLSVAFIRGASGTTDFKDVTAHAYSRGGMLLEASLGGQKFRYMGGEEAAKELAKKREKAEGARAKVANAGQAAKSLAGAVAKRAGGFLKRHLSS